MKAVGLLLLLFVLLAGLALLWRQHQSAARTRALLPPLPTPALLSPGLRDALAAAQARAIRERAAPAAVEELARLYHGNSFNQEARACWQRLHAAEPAVGRWCYLLADASRAAGDEEAYRTWLADSVRLAPNYAPAWLQWGELEFKTGHPDAAAVAYGRRLALVPNDPYAKLGLARLALQAGRREEGLRRVADLVRQARILPRVRISMPSFWPPAAMPRARPRSDVAEPWPAASARPTIRG